MPTYQYACQSCGFQFEKRQRFSEEPLKNCPDCEGTIQRVINPVGIIFKGSGFYITDNKTGSKNGNGNSSKKTEKNGSGSKPKTEAKAEKAPAS